MGRKYFKAGTKISFLKENSGMTLSEIIVVVAILGLLIVLAAMSINPKLQLGKARDSRRKADMQRIAISLEDYAGDNPCYPTAIYNEASDDCVASMEIDPYLKRVPCDPLTNDHYEYVRPKCKEFIIYTSLETQKTMTYGAYDYALSSPNLRVIPTVSSPTGSGGTTSLPATPTPTISTESWPYYGCFGGACRYIEETQCTPHYQNATNCTMAETCTYNCCCSLGGDDTYRCKDPETRESINECI